MKITLLILIGFLTIALGSLAMVASKVQDNIAIQYSQASEEPLVDFAHLLAALLEGEIQEGKIDVSNYGESIREAFRRDIQAKIYHLEKTELSTNIYITDENGIVVFDSQDNGKREGLDYSQFNDVYLTWQGKYGKRASRIDPEDSRTTVFYVAAPIRHEGSIIGTLTVFRAETVMAPFAEQSQKLVANWTLTAGLITAFLGAIWIYWLLHPIRNLTEHARLISIGASRELPVTGRAELRKLSIALEEMRRELEGKHYVENYVQALTHELKSPLAAIRGAAELIDESMPAEKRQHFLNNILAETSRSEDLVRRLVHLAALESQSSLATREKIEVSKWVADMLDDTRPAFEAKELKLTIDDQLSETDAIEGDPLMIQIAFRNVVNNAIDFSPVGGEVTIECRKDDFDRLQIIVSDSGPGLPDYAIDRVFDRFYSLKNKETGRKGAGIGLALTREAMALHQGTIRLENRQNSGTRAVLSFPIIRG